MVVKLPRSDHETARGCINILLDKYTVYCPYYPSWFCVFVVAFRDSQKRFLEVLHPSLSLNLHPNPYPPQTEAGDGLFLAALKN